MSLEQQHAILDKTYKDLTKFCGKPPRGNVAPWWEASKEGAELMLKYGVEYGGSPCSPLRNKLLSVVSFHANISAIQITAFHIMIAFHTIYGPATVGLPLTTPNIQTIG